MTDQHTERTPPRRGLVGRMLGERYRITRLVASGASTIIVDADDTDRHRPVTVKLVRPEFSESPEFRDRFRHTMQVVAKLSHPNIAAVHDWGEEVVGNRATVYAVTEYLGGGSLRDLFDRGRYLDPSQALMIGLEACRGLDYAHRKGLVHSEVTPAKLVFGDDRRLRIVDFGLARLLGRREWADPSRVATHVARYASPEQAAGERLNGQSDVYSLALVLVEAVTQRVPFAEGSTTATLSARIGRLMPVSADLGALASVLERAGRPIAADRFTAGELGRALVRSAEKLPRPTPIPIVVVSEVSEDTSTLRRPNDPTGGVRRPLPEPAVALVPAPVPSPEEPTESVAAGVMGAAAALTPVDTTEPSGNDGREASTVSEPTPEPEPEPETEPEPEPEPETDQKSGREPVHESEAEAGLEEDPETGADVAPAGGASDDTTGALKPPEPAPKGLYDGDADITKDELAALARTPAPTDGGVGRPAIVAAVAASTVSAAAPARPAPPAERGSAVAGPPSAPVPPRPSRRAERDGRSPWVVALGGFLVLAALAGLAFAAYLLFRVPRHEVPALIGLSIEEAEALVADFDWDVQVTRVRSDDEPDPGDVIEVNPEAGKDLAEGQPFEIVVSEGPEFRPLPELVGRTRGQAETALAELRLVAVPADEAFSEDVPDGEVISWRVPSEPELVAGGHVLPDVEVEFVVSKGPEPRTLPDLVGLTVEEATEQLDDIRIRINVSEAVFDNDAEAGEIVAANPPAGSVLERDATVTVTPSKGPDLVVMPDVIGQTLAQARASLTEAGLQVGSLLGSTAGTVVQTSVGVDIVEPGDEVLRYTAINLALI